MEVRAEDYAMAAARNLMVGRELGGRGGRALARLALKYLELARSRGTGKAIASAQPLGTGSG